MHPFFAPLNRRDTMTLLTVMTLEEQPEVLFEGLPRHTREVFQEKTNRLGQLPTKKRMAFIAHQMQQLLSHTGSKELAHIDPSWLLEGLRHESPAVVAIILMDLPEKNAQILLQKIPSKVRQCLPSKDKVRQIPVALRQGICIAFHSRFQTMPAELSHQGLSIASIIELELQDMQTLIYDLGAIELGQAFAAMGKMALAELCRRLPREKAKELIAAVRSASHIDRPTAQQAQKFLSQVVLNFDNTNDFFQRAGFWRLARAFINEPQNQLRAFKQRLPRSLGALFQSTIEKAKAFQSPEDEEQIHRLQDTIVIRLHGLAREKKIDASLASMPLILHDPSLQPSSAPKPNKHSDNA